MSEIAPRLKEDSHRSFFDAMASTLRVEGAHRRPDRAIKYEAEPTAHRDLLFWTRRASGAVECPRQDQLDGARPAVCDAEPGSRTLCCSGCLMCPTPRPRSECEPVPSEWRVPTTDRGQPPTSGPRGCRPAPVRLSRHTVAERLPRPWPPKVGSKAPAVCQLRPSRSMPPASVAGLWQLCLGYRRRGDRARLRQTYPDHRERTSGQALGLAVSRCRQTNQTSGKAPPSQPN